MSIFKFTNPVTGQPFEIKGPANLTEAQARTIFEQQLKAGSLTGLKSGSKLSAATQAAGGLTGAVSQVSQAASGIAGSATGALQGALRSVSTAQSQLGSALSTASALPGKITAGGPDIAAKSVAGISSALNNTSISNGIGIANFAKQVPAVASLGSISQPGVTATLSQVNKLVGQTAAQVSDAKGVGKFGLDASQLQSAGLIKPGTVEKFISGGVNSLTSVLKSPTVWTGKDGIKGIGDMLSKVAAQEKTQQELMSKGLAAVRSVGIPTNKLSPGALAGVAANAAKSPANTAKWALGAVGLATSVVAAFNTTAKDTKFAVDLANTKVPEAFKEQETPPVAEDTVNRETVNAAASRVIGDEKVPPVEYTSKPRILTEKQIDTEFEELKKLKFSLGKDVVAVANKIGAPGFNPKDSAAGLIQQLEAIVGQFESIIGRLLSLERDADASAKAKNQTNAFLSVIKPRSLYKPLIQQQIEFIQTYDITFARDFIKLLQKALQESV